MNDVEKAQIKADGRRIANTMNTRDQMMQDTKQCCDKCLMTTLSKPMCTNPNCKCHSVKASEENLLQSVACDCGRVFINLVQISDVKLLLSSKLQKVKEKIEKKSYIPELADNERWTGAPVKVIGKDTVFEIITKEMME